jgi:hypothetical protein
MIGEIGSVSRRRGHRRASPAAAALVAQLDANLVVAIPSVRTGRLRQAAKFLHEMGVQQRPAAS